MLKYLTIKQLFKGTFTEIIASMAMLFYFCADTIGIVLRTLFGNDFTVFFINFVLGAFIFLYFIFQIKKHSINVRIWMIYILVFLFVFSSVLLNPEYKDWFLHEVYGLKTQFFELHRGIYALLIVGMVHNKTRFISALVYTSRLNLIFYIIQYYNALRRGFWYGTSGSGATVEIQYNLLFGYRVAVCAVVFLLLYLLNKKLLDLVSFIVSFAIIIMAGSRGALVCIGATIILGLMYKWRTTKKTVRYLIPLLFFVVISTVLHMGFSERNTVLFNSARSLNIESRNVQMLVEGKMTEENGRDKIWAVAGDIILNEGPLGKGFFGDRYIIGKYWSYGYPHNIFLEILIQFGVPLGCFIIGLLAWNVIYMGVNCKDVSWEFLLIVLLSCCTKLLLSDSFWYYWPFWALIGVLCIWKRQRTGAPLSGTRAFL